MRYGTRTHCRRRWTRLHLGVLDLRLSLRKTENELIRSTQGAHNALLDLEELEVDELDEFRAKYEALAGAARAELKRGLQDTDTPEP